MVATISSIVGILIVRTRSVLVTASAKFLSSATYVLITHSVVAYCFFLALRLTIVSLDQYIACTSAFADIFNSSSSLVLEILVTFGIDAALC